MWAVFFAKLHISILNSCILTILFGRFNEMVHIMIPHTNTAEGCSLIRTFQWSATQRCLSAFWWASSADIRIMFLWIVISQERIFRMSLSGKHDVPLCSEFKTKQTWKLYQLSAVPMRNCWRASIASSQRWRRWLNEVTIWKPNSFTIPPQFAFSPQIELPRSSPLCLYFRSNCVNLPKSLSFYKLFS